MKAIGTDPVDSMLFAVDTTNEQLKQSATWGTAWYNNKTVPAATKAMNCARIVRFGAYLYLAARETTGGLISVFRALPQAGHTPFAWSAAVKTLAAGAGLNTPMLEASTWGTNDYLFVAEYGDPVGGPSICRSADGTTWETVFGPDPSVRHIHHVKPDPFNPGHVWATAGDGIAKSIMRSVDYGATWQVVVASSTWQGVQISFTSDYVFIAGDSQRGTVLVVDRATGTPYMASINWHANIAVPGGAAGDRYFSNCYYGAVDPDTGIYYCVANDQSTKVGNTMGLFYLPAVGGHMEILDKGGVDINMNNFVYMGGGYVITGMWRRKLLKMVTAPR